jgi:hypothetical protein
MSILVACRHFGVEFEPGREAIVGGVWRLCPDCRSPVVCPLCYHVLKSGTHRGPCPGPRRRR